eukprot:CAMPEP_0170631118 /NCGR_PEP_ID=MMETSP0224-20130122/34431_1 /TAXON_ID=285029 /ORGANISM="Togula jolla, Strain CCCM 725" /LENGTH=101 /DNA_ID=CAMNT_0010959357 /DNA_START=10 /DNA_END=315 /DNA_ORIENTATION=-
MGADVSERATLGRRKLHLKKSRPPTLTDLRRSRLKALTTSGPGSEVCSWLHCKTSSPLHCPAGLAVGSRRFRVLDGAAASPPPWPVKGGKLLGVCTLLRPG